MGKIAFMFSGQGAQYVGMGKSFYDNNKKVKELYDSCELVRPGTLDQSFNSDMETLTKTENTQPCLYLADLAAAVTLADEGITPSGLAGFSLGELPALAFGRAFSYTDGFKITCRRGAEMAKSASKYDTGMMAVLKSDNETVENICSKYENVYPVNYNCTGQLVVSGLKSQLEQFKEDVKEAKAKAVPLAVSAGFHSPFMDEASTALGEYIKDMDFSGLQIPVYSNYTSQPYDNNIKYLITNQINHPVMWEKIIKNMIADGFNIFIETGVGNTLKKLVSRISSDVLVLSFDKFEQLPDIKEAIKNA